MGSDSRRQHCEQGEALEMAREVWCIADDPEYEKDKAAIDKCQCVLVVLTNGVPAARVQRKDCCLRWRCGTACNPTAV